MQIFPRNCELPFPLHTHKYCFTENRIKKKRFDTSDLKLLLEVYETFNYPSHKTRARCVARWCDMHAVFLLYLQKAYAVPNFKMLHNIKILFVIYNNSWEDLTLHEEIVEWCSCLCFLDWMYEIMHYTFTSQWFRRNVLTTPGTAVVLLVSC